MDYSIEYFVYYSFPSLSISCFLFHSFLMKKYVYCDTMNIRIPFFSQGIRAIKRLGRLWLGFIRVVNSGNPFSDRVSLRSHQFHLETPEKPLTKSEFPLVDDVLSL